MRRIRTAFLKKINKKQTLDYVLELVESSNGTYYLLENDVNWDTGEFKKTELFKSHNDIEEIEDYFNSFYSKKIKEKYSPVENGAVFNGFKFLLDYTEGYITNKEEGNLVEISEEQPRLIRL